MYTRPRCHSASERGAAIRRILDERRADRNHRVIVTINKGSAITLDGFVECYADKEATVDAAVWAGEADVIVDRILVGQSSPADCDAHGRQAPADARQGLGMAW